MPRQRSGNPGVGIIRGSMPPDRIAAGTATNLILVSGSSVRPSAWVDPVASQAQMENATATAVFATPAVVQYHPGTAKAWVNFSGTGTGTATMRGSYNVSGVVNSSTGVYQIHFTTGFSGVSYVPFGINVGVLGWNINAASDLQATTCRLESRNNSSALANPDLGFLAFFGDQ
mgnify:CR=1 FL=1